MTLGQTAGLIACLVLIVGCLRYVVAYEKRHGAIPFGLFSALFVMGLLTGQVGYPLWCLVQLFL